MNRFRTLKFSLAASFMAVALAMGNVTDVEARGGKGAVYLPIPDVPAFFPEGHALAPTSMDDVDVRLVLVVDSSSSMKPDEFGIQIDVTAQALTSEDVQEAWFGRGDVRTSGRGPIDSIAIAVVEFGSFSQLRIPWVDFRADDPKLEERLALFAEQVKALKETRDSLKRDSTQLAGVMRYSQEVFAMAPWRAEIRDVLDIFSDGKNATQDPTYPEMHKPRRDLAAAGITVNALAIVNEMEDLDAHYRAFLVTKAQDIPIDYNGYVVPGRVWAVARNMQEEGNGADVITSFRRDVELAFRAKIVWETVQLEIQQPVIVSGPVMPAISQP